MTRTQYPMVWSPNGGFVLELQTGMLTEQLATSTVDETGTCSSASTSGSVRPRKYKHELKIFMETEPEDASQDNPGVLLMMRLSSSSLEGLLSSLDPHGLLSGSTIEVPVHDTRYGPYHTHSGRYDLRSGSLQPFPSPEEEMHIRCDLPETVVGRHPVSESCALKTGRDDPGDDEYKLRGGWIGLKTMIQK